MENGGSIRVVEVADDFKFYNANKRRPKTISTMECSRIIGQNVQTSNTSPRFRQ